MDALIINAVDAAGRAVMSEVTRKHLAGLRLALAEADTVSTDSISVGELEYLIAQASAAPEQEPVAWMIDWPEEPELGHYFSDESSPAARSRPLYTHADPSEAEWLRAELSQRKSLDAEGLAFRNELIQQRDAALRKLAEAQDALKRVAKNYRVHQIHVIAKAALLSATAQPAECVYPPLSAWPQWANWCGLDATGYWVFYECEPVTSEHGRTPNGGSWGQPVAGEPQPNWAVMIYRRPAQSAEGHTNE